MRWLIAIGMVAAAIGGLVFYLTGIGRHECEAKNDAAHSAAVVTAVKKTAASATVSQAIGAETAAATAGTAPAVAQAQKAIHDDLSRPGSPMAPPAPSYDLGGMFVRINQVGDLARRAADTGAPAG